MKRVFCMILLAVMLISLAGCEGAQDKQVSCQDVIAAYETAGYAVEHLEYPEQDRDYLCSIRVNDRDGDSICFHFFETDAQAQAYAQEREWNWAVWLISVAMLEPTWLTTKTYRNIEIEYDDSGLYKPFKELVR